MDRTIPAAPAPRPGLQRALQRISGQHAADTSADGKPSAVPAAGLAPATVLDHARLAQACPVEDARAAASLIRVTSHAPTVSDIGQLANGALRAIVPAGALVLYTVDDAHSSLVASYTSGRGGDAVARLTMSIGERLSGWVAANAQAMVNAHAELDCFELAALNLRFATCLPLLHGGESIGVLTFYTAEALGDEQVCRLETMASSLSVAVKNAHDEERADHHGAKAVRAGLRLVAAK